MPIAPTDIVRAVRAAVRADERLEGGLRRLEVACDDGTVSLGGEVPDVATKKIVARLAASTRGVRWVDDGMRVSAGCQMSDEAIAAELCARLAGEPTLRACALRMRAGNMERSLRAAEHPQGDITVAVDDGSVSLLGELPSWHARRIAGALAWWVAGVRDVHNWLGVPMSAPDDDASLAASIRVVLARDPRIEAATIDVSVHEGVATLGGTASSEKERGLIESDAWMVDGVVDVVDEMSTSSRDPARVSQEHASRRARRARRPRSRARRFMFRTRNLRSLRASY